MTDKVSWLCVVKVEKQKLHGTVERTRTLEPATLDKLFSLSEPEFLVCKLGLVSPSHPIVTV